MLQHNADEDSSRNCWRTARERDRLKARFLIRERVSAANPTDDHWEQHGLLQADKDVLQRLMVYVQQGDRSKFSVSFMASHPKLFSDSIQVSYVSEDIWAHTFELCLAWFGPDYSSQLAAYVQKLESFTVLEYAVWLRKYSIVGSILLGGGSPAQRGLCKQVELHQNADNFIRFQSRKVLQRFFSGFPLSLSSYIVTRVVSMRRHAVDTYQSCERGEETSCEKCVAMDADFALPLSFQLRFPSCGHVFCEPCFWETILKDIDRFKADEDVVQCLCCGIMSIDVISSLPSASASLFDGPKIDSPLPSLSKLYEDPSERRRVSLERLEALPANRRALKSMPKKKAKKSEAQHLAPSWSAAVRPSLGLTQDVRRDKFFLNIERQAFYYVQGCLDSGVDVVNWTNEYGQGGLFISSWRGDARLVKLLLGYGASAVTPSNGGSTPISVAEANGHHHVVELLRKQANTHLTTSPVLIACAAVNIGDVSIVEKPQVTMLIDPSEDHPGAGAFIVDPIASTDNIQKLLKLWEILPIEIANTKKKSGACSVRSYYCDCENQIQTILQGALRNAGFGHVKVFPHMRFLCYKEKDITLAPHVDLCRVDPTSEERSTHSFLLYLTDCEHGGETCLLRDLSMKDGTVVLASVVPKKGRLLVFPHACPHEGKRTEQVPKILLRGELKFLSSENNEK